MFDVSKEKTQLKKKNEQLLNSLNEEIFYEIDDGVNNFL